MNELEESFWLEVSKLAKINKITDTSQLAEILALTIWERIDKESSDLDKLCEIYENDNDTKDIIVILQKIMIDAEIKTSELQSLHSEPSQAVTQLVSHLVRLVQKSKGKTTKKLDRIDQLLKEAKCLGLKDVSLPSAIFANDRARTAMLERQLQGKIKLKTSNDDQHLKLTPNMQKRNRMVQNQKLDKEPETAFGNFYFGAESEKMPSVSPEVYAKPLKEESEDDLSIADSEIIETPQLQISETQQPEIEFEDLVEMSNQYSHEPYEVSSSSLPSLVKSQIQQGVETIQEQQIMWLEYERRDTCPYVKEEMRRCEISRQNPLSPFELMKKQIAKARNKDISNSEEDIFQSAMDLVPGLLSESDITFQTSATPSVKTLNDEVIKSNIKELKLEEETENVEPTEENRRKDSNHSAIVILTLAFGFGVVGYLCSSSYEFMSNVVVPAGNKAIDAIEKSFELIKSFNVKKP